jgi:hypothetical protein
MVSQLQLLTMQPASTRDEAADQGALQHWRNSGAATEASAMSAKAKATCICCCSCCRQAAGEAGRVLFDRPGGPGSEQAIMLLSLTLLLWYSFSTAVPADSRQHQIYSEKQDKSMYQGKGVPSLGYCLFIGSCG